MVLNKVALKQSLNKAYLKEKVNRSSIELFKRNLVEFLNGINEKESEEYVKNLVTKFLYDTYYNGKNKINTKGRIDLAIYEDKKPVVILEAKRPGSPDMVTTDDLNKKATHELMLYYLQERVEHGNIDIKYLIITNTHEWFIFDASVFDSLFYKNSGLMKNFIEWKNGQKARTDRDLFYNDIAKPFLKNITEEIKFTWFDIREFEKFAKNDNQKDDIKLLDLYKILSPAHLLKQSFANDSNSLDIKFYSELLHLIGLEEKKNGGKKIIQRKEKPDSGSLLENTITILIAEDRLHKLDRNGADFGTTQEERLFNVALELCITWINRILFLKLLEGQLVNYHGGDKRYRFLDYKTIPNYDELNKLFFQVLARKHDERTGTVKEKFDHVPYLNSSLFDISPLEDDTLRINSLDDGLTLKISSGTVLKTENGKKREGEMPTLQYLFEFLDAYDFASEGNEEIQEENKSLINASVLGLIFEKINGYKDGSFFTPGFITMYMCRETIRRAVVQKFNEAKSWKVESFEGLYNNIEDVKEANEIIDSLKICDPAVGSGHFLVSALNEIIAIKSELGVLVDRQGKRLRDYAVEVINDELIVSLDQHELFEYKPGNKESQRVQEALFHEKQTIIENCLFGVDINPNSVKICRLRLWIELLKNAYYTEESKYTQLETLPNIDINIKQGNSLISRFPLDADLSKALKSIKYSINDYKSFVNDYKSATDKEAKRGFEKLIEQIKKDFRTEISKYSDPDKKKLQTLNEEMFRKYQSGQLYDQKLTDKQKKDRDKLERDINKLTAKIKEKVSDPIYQQAFEWRFEFPEVLDKEGKFIGFDAVIGNPPYIRQEELSDIKNYLKDTFIVFTSGGDLFSYFYELSHDILKVNGQFTFINNTFDKTTAGKALREYVTSHFEIQKYIDFTDVVVFDEATTYPIVLIAKKGSSNSTLKYYKQNKETFNNKELLYDESWYKQIDHSSLNPNAWNFLVKGEASIFVKLGKNKSILELYGKCYYGVKTALNEAFITEIDLGNSKVLKAVYDGKDIKKWKTPSPFKKMIVFPSKSTQAIYGSLSESEAQSKMQIAYPEVLNHLIPFKNKAKVRADKGDYWWELRNCAYYDLFSKTKIIFPNLQNSNKFAWDESGTYLNAPAVFLPTEDKYLLGILNSKVVWHFLKSICVVRSGGFIEVKPQYFEQIPVPVVSEKEKKSIIALVDQILLGNVKGELISLLENELDQLIYKIYGLTEEEIKIIEQQNPKHHEA